MGTPEYAVYPLDKLLLGGHDIVGVYTQPDRQTGRGQQMKPPPVKVVAQSKGLDVFQPKSLKGEGVVAVLEKLKPDIIVVAAYGLILPRSVLQIPAVGTLNIHPSLLPAFPGLEAWKQAHEYGVKATGCTVHLVERGIDTGPILAQGVVPVLDDDTPETLHQRIQQEEHQLYPRTLARLFNGEIRI